MSNFIAGGGQFVTDLAKDGITVSGDSLSRDLSFNAQCFLIQNMFDIARKTEAVHAGGSTPPTIAGAPQVPGEFVSRAGMSDGAPWSEPAGGFPKHVELHRDEVHNHPNTVTGGTQTFVNWPSGYKFISPILSDDTYPPSSQFSKLAAQKDANAKALLDLSPSVQAQLVPLVRLYKVEYDIKKDADGNLDPDLRPDLSTGKDIEIIFDDFTREEALDQMVQDNPIQAALYENRGGRLGGAGIKSFSWDLKGVNPAEIDANITADLKIHFNSIDDLFLDDLREVATSAGARNRATFLDLIIHAPTQADVESITAGTVRDIAAGLTDPCEVGTDYLNKPAYLLYHGKFFEIKAVVGWQVPPHIRIDDGMTDDTALREVLRQTQTPLYMQLVSHQFKFEQDGSVDLDIHFRARLTARDGRYDILRPEAGDADLDRSRAKLAQLQKEKDEMSGSDEDVHGRSSEDLDAEMKDLEKELNADLAVRYQWILDGLTGRNEPSHGSYGRRGNPVNPEPEVLVQRSKLYDAMATPVQLRGLNTFEYADPTVLGSGETGGNQNFAQPMSMEGFVRVNNQHLVDEAGAEHPVNYGGVAGALADTLVFAGSSLSNRGGPGERRVAATQQPGAGTTAPGDSAHSGQRFENIGSTLPGPGGENIPIETLGDMEQGNAVPPGSAGAAGRGAQTSVGSVYQGHTFMKYGLSTNPATGVAHFEEWKFFEAPTVRKHKSEWSDVTIKSGTRHQADEANITSTGAIVAARLNSALDDDTPENMSMHTTSGAASAALGANRTNQSGVSSVRERSRFPVTFFLLGDLLDVVISRFRSTDPNNRGAWWDMVNGELAFVTTDIEFFNIKALYATAHKFNMGKDPTVFFKKLAANELAFSAVDRKRLYKRINIASIPIEFDRFLDWYIQKIVKPKRQRYFFYDFISDVLQELVAPALSSQCFAGVPPAQFQITLGDIQTDSDSRFSNALGWGPQTGQHGEGATTRAFNVSTTVSKMSQLVEMGVLPAELRALRHKEPGEPNEVHRTVKVLMATTLKPHMEGIFQKADGTGDFNSGIYHFILGADRGLLKRAVFNRTDAPFLREGRTNRNTSLGANQLRELYSVSLRLYGNTIIKPGQYIYVVPYPMGFGNPRFPFTISRTLGIGGYHLVTGVHSVIDRNGYETSLTALHEAMPLIDPRFSCETSATSHFGTISTTTDAAGNTSQSWS